MAHQDDPAGAPPPRWWRRTDWLAAMAVFVLTAALTALAFPPGDTPELAYVFAAPAALWAYRRPGWKIFAGTVLGAQALAWTVILGWLHHVTWGGMLLLGPVVGLWAGAWFLAVRWTLPRLPGRAAPVRVLAILGLAGLWVANEWGRTWLLGGFPWLPLAASQWQRAAILQVAAYTGAGGVSFTLVMMNLGFAAYAHRLWFENKPGLWRRSPEFLTALALLLTCLGVYFGEAVNRAPYAVPLARVAFVQPAIPQEVKWDATKRDEILMVLEDVTRRAAALTPSLILWPEATTPLPLNADPELRARVERLGRDAGAPLVLGSIAVLPGADGRAETAEWLNAAFVVDPAAGMQERIYAKRKLVPFGEYVPLRPLFGWLRKFVPIGDDFGRGESATPLAVHLPGQPADATLKAGTLICYEDIFPALARASAQAGADVLVVHTNNAWYGEGGMAYQHAAHSVLRAVETRRPVLRDGNAGWSGWIDEFGAIRAVLTRDAAGNVSAIPSAQNPGPATRGSVYFRGAAAADVTRDSRWVGRQSFYTEHGDWFVAAGAVLAVLAWFTLWRPHPATTKHREKL